LRHHENTVYCWKFKENIWEDVALGTWHYFDSQSITKGETSQLRQKTEAQLLKMSQGLRGQYENAINMSWLPIDPDAIGSE
jgi:hypothetical protein